jgi:hypothetical protein
MDNLTPNDQVKLQNIIQYYSEYRKTHYDDNVGIAIENQRRKEKRKEIYIELQKIEDIKTTEKYVLLSDEKSNICKQLETYYDRMFENKDNMINIYETIETLEILYDSIANKQINIIMSAGINKELLDNDIITKRL